MLRVLATAGLLVFGTLWGTLTRLGLVALNTYDGQSITPLIWVQGVGCLVMGWTTHPRNRAALEASYAPAYTMVTTGYCGSCTTLSSWLFDVFAAFSNRHHYQRHGLHNVMDALTQTAATLCVSLASLAAGRALAEAIALDMLWTPQRSTKSRLRAHAADVGSIALGAVFWAGAALLCGLYAPFRSVTYALVLSPLGTLLRWALATLNNRPGGSPHHVLDVARWPLGTLAANMLSTAVYCGAETGQYVGRATGPSSLGAHKTDACHALSGLQQGFCGALSTISTLATELTSMQPRRAAFAYLFVTWTVGVLLAILLVGAPWWTLGLQGGCTAG
ncbi:hypothetical protein MSPP1_003022 [Malassezia sp. CBS 17886]|nr:hypothetical protein MSPP1_003022 [Malassezia sp. CBS 17886]